MVANRSVARRYGEQNPAYEPAHPHLLTARSWNECDGLGLPQAVTMLASIALSISGVTSVTP
jgi:hypothetical protein